MSELNDSFVQRPDVQGFFSKVRVATLAEKDPDEPAFSPFERVHVVLRDGRRLASEQVQHPRGHFRRPLDREDLWQKFEDCAAPVLPPNQSRHLFDTLQSLPQLTSMHGRSPTRPQAAAAR
jgi:2-methylcitrate dehydratase PrpD